MSINFQLPKTARFLQCNTSVVATFNAPTLGKYNFNSQIADVLTMQANSIYFIERVNIGGTIPEEEYLYAIDTLPTAEFFNSVTRQQVLPRPIPVVNYIDNQEINAWVWTDGDGQPLQLRIAGILRQTPFLVGMNTVTLNIQVNVYDVADKAFIQQFRGVNAKSKIGFGAAGRQLTQDFYVPGKR
jgi:hypothetical protein